jgi:hypothetical protein
MRFLADESCDFAVVYALRATGHDVQAVKEICSGAPDEMVMQLAVQETRILLKTRTLVSSCMPARAFPSE